MKNLVTTLAALALLAGTAFAHEFKVGDLEIQHPASKATLPGQPVGGGFLVIIVVSFNLLGDSLRDALDPRATH